MILPRTHALRWFVVCCFVATFLASSFAAAADRIVWKRKTVNESNESWRLDMEFHFSKPPDIAHVPIQFEFEQTVLYEMTLEDGMEKPQMRRVPQENKQPLMETQDVGFLDPGSGKTMARTRFTFNLTRARGFEAGEYKVSVKNKRSGNKLGAPIQLVLKGDNEVVDRRSMVFEGKKKKKGDDKPKSWEQAPDPSEDPNSEAYWASGPAEPEPQGKGLPPPAHMQDKPGACGCRLPGRSGPLQGSFLLLALAVGGLVARRRDRG